MEEKTQEQKEEHTRGFLKKAFCIDGDIVNLGYNKITINDEEVPALVYQLEDSQRGTFIVTLSK